MRRILFLMFLAISLVMSPAAFAAIDVVFLIDGSGSIDCDDPCKTLGKCDAVGNEWQLMLQGIQGAVDAIGPAGAFNVAVVQFGGSGSALINLPLAPAASYAGTDVYSDLCDDKVGGATNFGDGFVKACKAIEGSSGTTQILCVISNGGANVGELDPIKLRDQAVACGYDEIDAFGVGTNASGDAFLTGLLYPLPPDPFAGIYSKVATFEELRDKLLEVKKSKLFPTLTEWGLILFSSLIIGYVSWFVYRKRRAVTTIA